MIDKINEITQSNIAQVALHHMFQVAAPNDVSRCTKTGRCLNGESS